MIQKEQNKQENQGNRVNPWEGMSIEEMNAFTKRLSRLGREIKDSLFEEKEERGYMPNPVLTDQEDISMVMGLLGDFSGSIRDPDHFNYIELVRSWDAMNAVVIDRMLKNKKVRDVLSKRIMDGDLVQKEREERFMDIVNSDLPDEEYQFMWTDRDDLCINSRKAGIKDSVIRKFRAEFMKMNWKGNGKGKEEQQRIIQERKDWYEKVDNAFNTTLTISTEGINFSFYKRRGDNVNDFEMTWEQINEGGLEMSYVGPEIFEPLNLVLRLTQAMPKPIAPIGMLSLYFPQGKSGDMDIPEMANVIVKNPEGWVHVFSDLKKNKSNELGEENDLVLKEELYLQHFARYGKGMDYGLERFILDETIQEEIVYKAALDVRAEVERRLMKDIEERGRSKPFWEKK